MLCSPSPLATVTLPGLHMTGHEEWGVWFRKQKALLHLLAFFTVSVQSTVYVHCRWIRTSWKVPRLITVVCELFVEDPSSTDYAPFTVLYSGLDKETRPSAVKCLGSLHNCVQIPGLPLIRSSTLEMSLSLSQWGNARKSLTPAQGSGPCWCGDSDPVEHIGIKQRSKFPEDCKCCGDVCTVLGSREGP